MTLAVGASLQKWTARLEVQFRTCTDDDDLKWATTQLLSFILKCSYFLNCSVYGASLLLF